MRFRDIRAGVGPDGWGIDDVPAHLLAATTPARPKSTAIKLFDITFDRLESGAADSCSPHGCRSGDPVELDEASA